MGDNDLVEDADLTYQLHHGDCLNIMPMIERESVDAVICDPPYGLGFMGKDWDHGVPGMHFWLEALRCVKPGAYLLAFGGTRTFHRLSVAIEDAGWEIRDTVMWVYGQGFPKSHDVSKAIDREAGAEREVIGPKMYAGGLYTAAQLDPGGNTMHEGYQRPWRDDPEAVRRMTSETSPATPAAAEWDGWGTALKPAWEPIIVARKPIVGTVAENVQRYGTGAMNIDACRIESDSGNGHWTHKREIGGNGIYGGGGFEELDNGNNGHPQGRWPANLIHDGSAEVLAGFPNLGKASNPKGSTSWSNGIGTTGHEGWQRPAHANYQPTESTGFNDTGSAARFFYCAKASKQDRDEGLEGFELCGGTFGQKRCAKCGRQAVNVSGTCQCDKPEWIEGDKITKIRNHHPTVKPTALMRYLCRLVTPPNGTILDPFMGSGSTGKAAMLEGFNFIGIDTEIEYVEIAARRIEHACEKVGIVIDQPMMFETKRETVNKPKQLILL